MNPDFFNDLNHSLFVNYEWFFQFFNGNVANVVGKKTFFAVGVFSGRFVKAINDAETTFAQNGIVLGDGIVLMSTG